MLILMKIIEISACHHKAYFEATIHQIRFRLGLPDSARGAYRVPPGALAGFQRPTSKRERGLSDPGYVDPPPILRHWH